MSVQTHASTAFAVRRAISALWRIFTIGLAAMIVSAHAAAQATTASGQFSGSKQKLIIASAYSYWDTASSGNDRVVKIAVSNAGFKPELIDAWYDHAAAIRDLFAVGDIKVVTFEFNADGKYRGYSYYFGSGDGCSYCYDSTVQTTVHPVAGRLKGKVAFKPGAEGASFDVELDVPIPEAVWGAPLPMGGGATGQVYLAFHKGLVAADVEAIKAVSTPRARSLYEKHGDGLSREYLNFRWDEIHHRMETATIVGGFSKGDQAVVQFDGGSKTFGALHGEAILRREGESWLVDNELIQLGTR